MSTPLERVHRVAARAARRALVAGLLTRVGACAAAGATVGLALVVIAKLGAMPWPAPPWLVALPVIAAAAIGATWAVLERWDRLRAARRLDDALGLKDRLSSALELVARAGDPFVAVALDEAGAAAADLDVPRAVPLGAGRAWWLAVAAVAGATLVAAFVPARVPAGAPRDARDTPQDRERAAEQIRALAPAGAPSQDSRLAASVERELAAVGEIERELAQGGTSPDAARTTASRVLERASAEAEREAATAGARADAVRTALSKSARAASEGAAPREGLAGPLKAGDIDSAAQAASRLAENADAMSPQDRQRAARELSELADALREIEAREARDRALAASDASQPATGTDEVDSDRPPTDSQSAAKSEAAPNTNPSTKPGQGENPAPRSDERAPSGVTGAPRPDAAPRREQPKPEQPKPSGGAGGQPQSQDAGSSDATRPPDQAGAKPAPDSAKPAPATGADSTKPPDDRKPDESSAARGDGTPQPRNDQRDGARKELERLERSLRDAARQLGAQPRQGKQGAATPGEGKPDPTQTAPQPAPGADQTPAGVQPESGQQQGVRDTPAERGTPSELAAPRPEQGARQAPGGATAPQRQPRPAGDKGSEGAKGEQPPAGKEGATDQRAGDGKDPNRARDRPGDGAKQNPAQDKTGVPAQTEPGKESAPGEQGAGADTKDGPGAAPRNEGERDEQRQAPNSGDQPGQPGGSALERLAKDLHRLGQLSRSAQDQKQVSRDLREQARRLLENADPKDLRRIAEIMRGQPGGNQPCAGQQGPDVAGGREGVTGERSPDQRGAVRTPDLGGRSELVDARPKTPQTGADRSHAISQWSGDPSADPAAPVAPEVMGERVRAAAAGAERAVEQQVVPSQYGPFVKRVFRKFVERAASEQTAPGATPALPDAPDARPR